MNNKHDNQAYDFINPWLDGLDYDWSLLENQGTIQKFNIDDTIFHQNELGEYLYIIVSGRVRLSLISPNGEEKALAIIGVNGILGECSLNNDLKYATNAITASQVIVQKVKRTTFLSELSKNPNLYTQLLDMITHKYRLLCMQSMELSYLKSMPRVCATFINLAMRYGDKIKDQQIKLTISFTHQEMANLLGITRVTIAKNIKWLEGNGYLIKNNKHYTITNLDSLVELANQEMMLQ
ncbi:Crp/Fnr family transcriptional regulator [Evansella sp. AB-rgal1]|uniref:Crp/Fnr family transcriptional regulator n=1 Tax=Evansella sp. AB-rgal1 TaxID=3242696 RepID=UPI00359F0060